MKTKLFALAFLFASSVLFGADQLCINITGMSPGSVLTPVVAPEAGAVLCSNTPKTGTFCEFNIGKGETVVIRGSYRLIKPEELKK